jgi:protein-S-isoprenylcysteine O-methyltransferase Ste14
MRSSDLSLILLMKISYYGFIEGIIMSLLPAFELGMWNAWIFIIPVILYWFFGVKFLFSKRMTKTPSFKKRNDQMISTLLVIILFSSFLYSVFVPLQLETVWFYIGSMVYLVGLVVVTITMIEFATTPINEPVIKGLYRYSRNPMFIGIFLIYIGISIECLSWVYMVFAILFILMINYLSTFEEAITIGQYGKPYMEYIKRTPKWIGIPKSNK